MTTIIRALDDAIAPIVDGCLLAVPREDRRRGHGGHPRSPQTRRQAGCIWWHCRPRALQADLLIGAGCVETLETSAVSSWRIWPGAPLHRRGLCPARLICATPRAQRCTAQFQAGEKGVPFIPLAQFDWVRRPRASPGLEGDRQSVRQQRSDRAAAGAACGCACWVPRSDG